MYRKLKNFTVEIFSLYSRSSLHHENIAGEMHTYCILVCGLQPVRTDDLPDGKGPFSSAIPARRGSQEAGAREGSHTIIEEEEQLPEYRLFGTKMVEFSVSLAMHGHVSMQHCHPTFLWGNCSAATKRSDAHSQVLDDFVSWSVCCAKIFPCK